MYISYYCIYYHLYCHYYKDSIPKFRYNIYHEITFVDSFWICTIFACNVNTNGYIHMYRVDRGIVYFDIDCEPQCWNLTHIEYVVVTLFAIFLVIPGGMYLRIKFQEIPTDLNLLTNPKFIVIKTSIITYMIVISKMLREYNDILTVCLSAGMQTIVVLQI